MLHSYVGETVFVFEVYNVVAHYKMWLYAVCLL